MTTYEVVIYTVLFLLMAGVLAWWIINQMRYKHRITVRELASSGKLKYVIYDRATDFTDEKERSYWKLKKEKDKLKKFAPVPPAEAINMTKRGRKQADAYRTEEGEYIWIKDTTEEVQPFHPISQEQRGAYFGNIDRAHNRRKTDWKKDLPMYINLGFLTILVLCTFVFGPDLLETLTSSVEEINAQNMQHEERRHQMDVALLEAIDRMLDDKCVQPIK